MKRKRWIACLLTAVMLLTLSGCLSARDKTAYREYEDMPLSGENAAIGAHDDAYGYHILNRYALAAPQNYQPKRVAHSYQSLDTDVQRLIYEKVLEAAYCFSDEKSAYNAEYQMRPLLIQASQPQKKEVEAALVAALDDHPELFWMSTDFEIVATGKNSFGINLNAYYTAAEVVDMMEKLDTALAEFFAGVPSGLSAYEREVMIYRYIIDNCVYDESIGSSDTYGDEHPSLFNLYGVMVDHKAVCEGYSYTFDYLCSQLGIDAVCLCGTTDSEGDEDVADSISSDLHLWNAVELDGEWYMVDCTWDDLDDKDDYGGVYTYLNIPDDILKIDHSLDKTYAQLSDDEYAALTSFVNNFVPPPCTATEYCYFMREGVHLSDPDPDALSDGIVNAVEKGRTSVMVCIEGDQYTQDEMAKALFEGSQPYYQAMKKANERLKDHPLDVGADALYYTIHDFKMIVFKINYR